MIEYRNYDFEFEETDLTEYAEKSGDYNPLHMDELYAKCTLYEKRVVFGMLVVEYCINKFESNICYKRIESIFRQPIFIGERYSVKREKKDQKVILRVFNTSGLCVEIRIKNDKNNQKKFELPVNIKPYVIAEDIDHPYNKFDEFLSSYNLIKGKHKFGCYGSATDRLNILFRICSYIVGMVIPGKHALFMRSNIEIQNQDLNGSVFYRIYMANYNRPLGVCDLYVSIETKEGVVATAELQAYVRESFDILEKEVNIVPIQEYQGQIIFITGGSKGLGRSLAKEYVSKGANVIVNYSKDDDAATNLVAHLSQKGGRIRAVKGNIGDYQECQGMFDYVKREYGKIDILICNACTPPQSMKLTPRYAEYYTEYITKNIQLLFSPLSMSGEIMDDSGKIIFISSEYVDKINKFLPEYVGLKAQAEMLLKCYAEFYKERKAAIFRVPKMLTEMNNSPTGRIGTVPPDDIAKMIVSTEKNMQEDSSDNNCYQYRISSGLKVRRFF